MSWTSRPPGAGEPRTPVATPWWRSVRFRTALAMTTLATVMVVAAGAVFARTAIVNATGLLRDEATAQLNEAIATQSFGGDLPSKMTENPKVLPRPLHAALTGNRIMTYDDGTWMWAARRQASGVIAIRIDDTPLHIDWTQLRRTFALAAVLAALIAAIGSWIAADRLTVRLRLAARAVDDSIAGRPVQPITGSDEVAVLAHGLASTAAALARSLDHERAISAEVAHDMRTPLTALIGAAELLPGNPDSARVQRIAQRLRRLLDDLLDLSRAAHESRSASLCAADLGRSVADILRRDTLSSEGIRFKRRRTDTVMLDESHLTRALANLLANAASHGRDPVEIRVDGPSVTVRDHGRGFPVEILRDGPRRFGALGTNGNAGIGLAIVLQHVAAMRATLTLRNHQNGAEATITLLRPGTRAAA